jgi:Helicase HerA, central domain
MENKLNKSHVRAEEELFSARTVPQPKTINFLIGTQAGHEGTKAYLVELDPAYQCRVGDLLAATDSRTGRRYLLHVSDIDPAYPHREEHAEMLDLLRRRPDKHIDEPTFRALCKNMAICSLVGEICIREGRDDGKRDHFVEITDNGFRPNKYTTTAEVAEKDVEELLVGDWQSGVPLGCLRLGRDKRPELRISFPTTALVGQRVLIVGQTGKGKSNVMRKLLHGHTQLMHSSGQIARVGFLVDDFKMEYAFDGENERGQRVPGLAESLGSIARERLVIFTCNPSRYQQHKELVRDIVPLQLPLDELRLAVFCELASLTESQTNVVRLVEETGNTTAANFFDDLFATDEHDMPDVLRWGRKYGRVFYSAKGRDKARKGEEISSEDDVDQNLRERLAYIRRAAFRLLQMRFVTRSGADGTCLSKLFDYIREGCTIILDKDGLEDHEREQLTVMLLFHLFRHNQALASGSEADRKRMLQVVVAVEEAQYLLSKDKVADPDSIFAKIAFTGRSYKIGLLAITQRPQAIQKELLGQFDGFIVLPMEHLNDFKHLAEACPALSGYRQDLASAPVGGAVIGYGTPKRVVSVQVDDFAALKAM